MFNALFLKLKTSRLSDYKGNPKQREMPPSASSSTLVGGIWNSLDQVETP
jgi:hypothetical protein